MWEEETAFKAGLEVRSDQATLREGRKVRGKEGVVEVVRKVTARLRVVVGKERTTLVNYDEAGFESVVPSVSCLLHGGLVSFNEVVKVTYRLCG